MYPLKLPYYPQVAIMAEKTPSGFVEISNPELYNAPLKDKVILKIDLLKCLEPVLGSKCMIYRKYLYDVLAGKGDVAMIFGHMYRRHPDMFAYVNDINTYGDSSVPLIDRCLEPLRESLSAFEEQTLTQLQAAGAKYLVTTHGYIYVCFNVGLNVPDVIGGTIIDAR